MKRSKRVSDIPPMNDEELEKFLDRNDPAAYSYAQCSIHGHYDKKGGAPLLTLSLIASGQSSTLSHRSSQPRFSLVPSFGRMKQGRLELQEEQEA